jgi:hypothetical protein
MMRPLVRRRPDGVIQITPRHAHAAIVAKEAGALLGLLGACAGFLTMLATVLVRHPLSLALIGSCLVFGLTTARWVSTGELLPAAVADQGADPARDSPTSPGEGPTGAA